MALVSSSAWPRGITSYPTGLTKDVFWGILKSPQNEGENKGLEITLDEDAFEYEVEYYTEAPQAFEQEKDRGKTILITLKI